MKGRVVLDGRDAQPLPLAAWVEAGWLEPGPEATGDAGVHLSRAQLIMEMKEDLGVNDEAVPVILDLIDKLYGVRQALRLTVAELRQSRNFPGQGGDQANAFTRRR
jgi:chaperone modulatory protein CbpM